MIEPSDNERSQLPETTWNYLNDLESELDAKDKQIAELEKDRARLEWLARDPDTFVQKLESGKYSVHWWANRWKETNAHDTWRDAIDKAMAQ